MDSTVMPINKGNAHGTQGERSNGDNSDPYRLLVKPTKRYKIRFLGPYCKLRIFVFSPTIYGPRASHLGHKSKGKKLGP